MKTPWANLEGYPRAIVLAVCVLLVSGGMCGVQAVVANMPKAPGFLLPIFTILGAFELLGIGASALVLVICLVAWPISAGMRRGSKQKSEGE